MFIGDLFEDGSSRRIVVTYPGRFQPFHLGHAEVFRSLQSKFGADNVFIVTSNKVDGEKSPFNFSDKVRFMHAAGIPDHSIIEASQVYKLPDQFDGQKENLIFVVAVGEPDKQRLNPGTITKKTGGPSYFQNLPEDLDQAEMSDRHGYVVVASERQKTVSIGGKQYDVSHGTEVRKLWNHIRNSPEQRQAFMKQLYGRSDPDLANILDKIPQSMAEEGGVGVVKAGDKRYSNALTVDVKPDTLGKEMKAYGLVGRKSPSTQQQKVGKGVGKGVYDGVAEDAENFNGIDISLEIQKDDEYVDDEDYDNQVIYVTASSKGKELGHVLFAFDGEYLMPQDLEVEERYRGQGIAQIMYDYVKSKGYKIRRSGQQTDAGAGFWDKHKGQGQNVWEQGVAEALTYPQKHSSWSVCSPKKNEFNTRYKLDQEPEARAHAERIGGKLVKVDQRGHAIRTGSKGDKGVAEGSLEEVSQDTARSYAQKAQASQKDLINQTYRKGADTDALNKKIKNRQQGMDRAHTDKRYYKDELGVAEGSLEEVSDKTLTNYLTKVDADSRKHRMDPTKRPAHKASKSIAGFATAFNKLDSHKEKAEKAEKTNEGLESEKVKMPNGQRPKGIGWVLKQAGEQSSKDYSVWERKFNRVNEQGVDEEKQRLDPKCWTGKHKEGTKMKGGVRVNNCVPNESSIMKGIKV